MSSAEITFTIVLIGIIAAICFIYRIIRECDRDEDDDDIWG